MNAKLTPYNYKICTRGSLGIEVLDDHLSAPYGVFRESILHAPFPSESTI